MHISCVVGNLGAKKAVSIALATFIFVELMMSTAIWLQRSWQHDNVVAFFKSRVTY